MINSMEIRFRAVVGNEAFARTSVSAFVMRLNPTIEQIDEIKNAPVGVIVNKASAADELKKFKELLDLGAISQEEFDAKKKQLLGL